MNPAGHAAGFEVRIPPHEDPVIARITAHQLVLLDGSGATRRELYLDDVEEVACGDRRVTVTTTRGDALVLNTPDAKALDLALVEACCTLPELTRTLRSFGTRRVQAGAPAQLEFMAPLLDARRRAEEAVGREAVVAAFDSTRIERGMRTRVAALVARGGEDPRPAAQRAIHALADDAVQPVLVALADVRATAADAVHPPADARVASWRRWRLALEALFRAADSTWTRLAAGLSLPASR